jgi:antitoxin YefM
LERGNSDLVACTGKLYNTLMARSVTYSALRANLKLALDRVTSDREPILVERKKGEPVVLVAESDYRALEETAYLLRSPANARRLLNALHGKRAKDKRFRNVDELRARLGLRR